MIAVVATYLLWVMVAGYVAVWLFAEDRRGKLRLGISAVIGLIIVLILIQIAGSLYYDARPFVDNPSIVPLIPHAPDNGFPSDHAAAAGLIAVLIALRHRWYGLVLGVAAAAVAWSRVAAHVHHVQDVAAGLALGVVAALLGAVLAWLLVERTRLLRWPALARIIGPPEGGSDTPEGPVRPGERTAGSAGSGRDRYPGRPDAPRHRR